MRTKNLNVDLLFEMPYLAVNETRALMTGASSRVKRLLLAARDQGGRGEPRQFGSQPSHSRHRSGLVSRCRRAGRCRWETPRWLQSHRVPAATSVTTQVSPSDNGSLAAALSRAPSLRPRNTDDAHHCWAAQFR